MGVQLFGKVIVVLAPAFALLCTASADASIASDKAIAKVGLLTVDDFAPGWRAQPADKSDNDVEQIAKGIPSCRSYLALRTAAHKNPRAASQDFEHDDDEVSNTVNVFSTDDSATAALAALRKPSTESCLRRLFKKTVEAKLATDSAARAQIESIDVQVGQLSAAGVGDEVLAFEAVITVHTTTRLAIDLYLDTEFVRVGRAIDTFSFQATGQALTDTSGYIDASVGRLTAALA